MKRNLLILFVIFITLLPYVYVWYTFDQWEWYFQYAWAASGLAWGIVCVDMKKYGVLRNFLIYTINVFAWPSCLAIWLYCKLILKRDTLFAGKNTVDTPPT